MIVKDLFVSYQERMRRISQDAPECWILINSRDFTSLSINDEERAYVRWGDDSHWDYMAHNGVLYARNKLG